MGLIDYLSQRRGREELEARTTIARRCALFFCGTALAVIVVAFVFVVHVQIRYSRFFSLVMYVSDQNHTTRRAVD